MATAIRSRYPVALEGFSDFERAALASYFRLIGDRDPTYEHAPSIDDARFIVADADIPGVVDAVVTAQRAHDTVFIGAQAPEGAMAWMMRPIDPMHVLRELDANLAMPQPSPVTSRVSSPRGLKGHTPKRVTPAFCRRATDAPASDDTATAISAGLQATPP
ncbi:MAG TPA: hypothetical protein VFP68_24770 [Burkholderiaceae bacterium]|nr:hypothetical protein [Burkholderiaceae bacterium]